VQLLIGDVAAAWVATDISIDTTEALAMHAPFVAAVTIGAAIVPLAVIALAVRLSGCSLANYLGFFVPAARFWFLGLAALAILIPLVDFLSRLAGHAATPEFVLNLYRSARDTHSLLFLLLAIALAAPLVEEVLFRGFLLPGLAASALGRSGALMLTSGAWALLHWQYHPFYLIQIILLGVLFGWLRLVSGSTVLTIVLHGLLNSAALVQAAFIVERLR
jgi:membrane protease YdiL (CAAX protease family)